MRVVRWWRRALIAGPIAIVAGCASPELGPSGQLALRQAGLDRAAAGNSATPAKLVGDGSACRGGVAVAREDLDRQLHTFYRDPRAERVMPILVTWQQNIERIDDEAGAWELTHFMIGWTAATLIRHPQCADLWTTAWTGRFGRVPYVVALYLAGQRKIALKMADRGELSAVDRAGLAQQPATLLSTSPRDPLAMDRLWGAAFATGRGEYLKPIVEALVSRINEGEVTVEGVYALAFRGEGADAVIAGIQQQSTEVLLDHVLAARAWGYLSNYARHHAFVRACCGPRGGSMQRVPAPSS